MKLTRRPIIIAVGMVTLVILAASAYFFLLPKGKEIQDLHVALVKLEVAEQHGTNLPQFTDLLFDARTKFELARPHMFGWDATKCQVALDLADDVSTIWRGVLNDEYSDDLYEPMLRLGIVHTNAEFKKIQADIVKYKANVGDSSAIFDVELKIRSLYRQQYVSLALHGLSVKISPAVLATQ